MASASLKKPPLFNEEECDYEEWKKDLELWTLLTNLPKNKVAIAVHLSLSGRARQATSELSVDCKAGSCFSSGQKLEMFQ